MTGHAFVSVIVVNHNGRDLLPGCLGSVLSQSCPPAEIILVDNGSGDGSVELVRRDYPAVKILINEVNAGYAPAANQGIQAARGKFIALLNNDAQADSGWIENLLRVIEKDERIGSCSSKQLNFYKRDVLDSTGILLHRGGYPVGRGRNEIDRGQFDAATEILGAAGASALYRRTMLDQAGLFDEDYVSYQEEFDLSLRAKLYGWRCVYVPEAVVYHISGATVARKDEKFLIYYTERNRLFTIIKNYPASMILRYLPYLAKYELDILWRVARGECAPVSARFDALKLLPRMLRKRREIQKKRTASNREFQSWVVS